MAPSVEPGLSSRLGGPHHPLAAEDLDDRGEALEDLGLCEYQRSRGQQVRGYVTDGRTGNLALSPQILESLPLREIEPPDQHALGPFYDETRPEGLLRLPQPVRHH